MIKGKTKTGFFYEINENLLDDFDFLELISAVDTDMTKFPQLIEKMFGEKQVVALKKFINKKAGYVSTKLLVEEVKDVMETQKRLKNF